MNAGRKLVPLVPPGVEIVMSQIRSPASDFRVPASVHTPAALKALVTISLASCCILIRCSLLLKLSE